MVKTVTTSMLFFLLLWTGQESAAQTDFWVHVGDSRTNNTGSLAIGKDNAIYAAVYTGVEGKLYRSTDYGASWTDLNVSTGAGMANRILVNSRGDIFANMVFFATYVGFIARSTDEGTHWTELPQWGVMLAIDDSDHIFGGAPAVSGILRSTDNGGTWDSLGSGLPLTSGFLAGVYSLAFHPSGDAYAASVAGGVCHSSDHGTSWHSEANSLSDCHMRGLTVSPTGDVYVVQWQGSTPNGVFRSTDKASSWTCLYSLSSVPQTILCTASGDVYVGTGDYEKFHGGVFKNGVSISSGLPSFPVGALALDSLGYLYVGTYGGGIYRSTEAVTGVSEARPSITSEFSLEQNYPNPFNPTTQIEFALPHRSHVMLTVFNTLGQQVATLVNAEVDAGYHSLQFDGSGLASGAYFYRLQAGGFVQTKKLYLVK